MKPVNTDTIGAIRNAQDTLGLSPVDAQVYVTRLLGTGMGLDEILAWIASGTSSAKTVLSLIPFGITPDDAGYSLKGKKLGEELSYGEPKQAKRMKRARKLYANAPFEIIGEAFAEYTGTPVEDLQDPEVETLLMKWSNEASRWLSQTLVNEQNVPQRSALPLAMSIILTDADELVGSCVEGRPQKVRNLDRDNVTNFVGAMRGLTQKILHELT